MTEVTALIVNWNAGGRLGRSVDALSSTSEADILIVDNASSDGSLDGIDSHPRVRVLRNPSNAGFAAGVNQGFAVTRTPYVLILNPDVRAQPGAVAALVSVMNDNPQAGAAGGFVNEAYLPRPLPTVARLVRENLGLGATRIGRGESGLVRVDQPAASALMVRREAFEAVGGFDEQFYPAWYEDVDFSKALATSGWEAYFEPRARFEHDGGYAYAALGTERFMRIYYTNQFRYARKHLGARSVAGLKAALVAGVVVRSAARPRHFASYWRGLRQVLTA